MFSEAYIIFSVSYSLLGGLPAPCQLHEYSNGALVMNTTQCPLLRIQPFTIFPRQVGNLTPIYTAAYPSCWKTHKTCTKELLGSLTYTQVCGIIVGMLTIGASLARPHPGVQAPRAVRCCQCCSSTTLKGFSAPRKNRVPLRPHRAEVGLRHHRLPHVHRCEAPCEYGSLAQRVVHKTRQADPPVSCLGLWHACTTCCDCLQPSPVHHPRP